MGSTTGVGDHDRETWSDIEPYEASLRLGVVTNRAKTNGQTTPQHVIGHKPEFWSSRQKCCISGLFYAKTSFRPLNNIFLKFDWSKVDLFASQCIVPNILLPGHQNHAEWFKGNRPFGNNN